MEQQDMIKALEPFYAHRVVEFSINHPKEWAKLCGFQEIADEDILDLYNILKCSGMAELAHIAYCRLQKVLQNKL